MANLTSPKDQHTIPACSCVQEHNKALPVDLWPQVKPKKGNLRKSICPGCGMVYSTNRKKDLCFDYEKKIIGETDHRNKSGC